MNISPGSRSRRRGLPLVCAVSATGMALVAAGAADDTKPNSRTIVTPSADAVLEGTSQHSLAVSDVSRALDAQVWIPMLRASDRFDADGFLAVQSAGVIRVSVDRNEVYGSDRYSGEIRTGFARAKERKVRRTSTVRFLTRTNSGAVARDTGIFRSDVVLASGQIRITYTAFEMIFRNEDGRWKLLLDRDSSRGGTITEQDYLEGAPLVYPERSLPQKRDDLGTGPPAAGTPPATPSAVSASVTQLRAPRTV